MEPWVALSNFDRAADERRSDDSVWRLWASPEALFLGVDEDSRVTCDEGRRALRGVPTQGDFDASRHFLAGFIDGQPWFTGHSDQVGAMASLRSLGALLDETHLDLVTTAVALVNWHKVAPYCGQCGTLTQVREGGHLRWCERCQRQRFPRTDPAIIVAILDDTGRLLLGHHVNWDPTRVSILAGFVEAGESLEQAVHREIFEESGLRLSTLRYLGSQPWPFPRSLMLGFVARSIGTEITVDGTEIQWANFYTRTELEALVAAGELTLPMKSSIASRIITAWRRGELTG